MIEASICGDMYTVERGSCSEGRTVQTGKVLNAGHADSTSKLDGLDR